jgi:sphinganine-1-phosphate aldolase
VLIYRNSKIRRHQYFSFATWPGGIYISPTALGSRNGGALSGGWGSLLHLGINGFKEVTEKVLVEVDKMVSFIKNH